MSPRDFIDWCYVELLKSNVSFLGRRCKKDVFPNAGDDEVSMIDAYTSRFGVMLAEH